MTTRTFSAWAKPVSAKVFDQPIGDHTWITTDTTGECWGALGDNRNHSHYYCSDSHWSTGVYVPPGGSRRLLTVSGDLEMATCMGDPKETDVDGWASSAGVRYALNGVCHQIANRVIYATGQTVKDAKGSGWSYLLFGAYGTLVPLEVLVFSPFLWPVYAALQAGVLTEWSIRIANCGAPFVPPADGRFESNVAAFHKSLTPATMTPALVRRKETELFLSAFADLSPDDPRVEAIIALGEQAPAAANVKAAQDIWRTEGEDGAARALGAAFDRRFAKIRAILGDDLYAQTFGVDPDDKFNLIQPHRLKPTLQAAFGER